MCTARSRVGLQTILYLLGGGFVIGPHGYDARLRQLALPTGCLIVALHCRLAPEHRFHAAIEDAVDGADWLATYPDALGGLTAPLGVVGDSSAGNLAATVARTVTRAGAPLAFQVLLYPMLGATASSPSYIELASGYGFLREKSVWYLDQCLPPQVDRCAPRVTPLFEPDLSRVRLYGGGEETTGRKADTGASPPTVRGPNVGESAAFTRGCRTNP